MDAARADRASHGSFWRVNADTDGTLYSAAYADGDTSVKLFSSVDGITWTAGAMIYDNTAARPRPPAAP